MSEEGFIGRWSRLKRQGHGPEGQDIHADDLAPEVLAENHMNAQLLTDEDMPPLDSLDESSDYSLFMSEKVSESLRKAALRKMFHMPSMNVVDGMDDYAEDFTKFEPLGNVITHDMARALKRDAERPGQYVEPDDVDGATDEEVLEPHKPVTDLPSVADVKTAPDVREGDSDDV